MFKFRVEGCNIFLRCRFYSVQASTKGAKDEKYFQHTVLLPKTSFPNKFKPHEIIERDKRVQKEARLLECYAWQRDHLKGEEYVLHDGPPYANGKPHIGHAINKISKDIFLRSRLIQGRKIHYVPGWDCHGLPIELVALKNAKNSTTAIEIRKKAREVASSMSRIQMDAFKQWGVIGDWDKQCYYTFDTDYVINQLQLFWKLYEKGLIYYDLKPVFWSPSSRTALAESELVYKNHISPGLTVRFETIQDIYPEPTYLLVWTTTPWTLPLNQAVYYSKTLKYSLVRISSFPGLYIMATDLIKNLQEKLQKQIEVQSEVSEEIFKKLKYKHPWNQNKVMKLFGSSQVKVAGTGLLHSVPAHGHEDFVMGLENNLNIECLVNERGCYTAEAGPELEGLNVLNEGSEYVIKRLSSDIILHEKYEHSYPYDWRTDKPIIIRASKQWFIDTNQIKDKALEILKNVQVPVDFFSKKLSDRVFWCLSRQRTWGVPIPAFFHRTSGRPLMSKDLIHHICNLMETSGPDVWWTEKIETLFPPRVCQELFVNVEDVVKGEDIMDIWFDSGISWSYVLKGKKSELYFEGVDQYGGWFQTSLLTSVATGNGSPFKRIMTHGFAVDEKGRKMSKSLGNVVDPQELLEGKNAMGVDVLRWWVGCHSHHSLVPVSESILDQCHERVKKIRSVLRFLLGALHGASREDLENKNALETLDRYMLNSCSNFYRSVINGYNSYDLHDVCSEILFFVPNEISSRYITVIKDRLYCDSVDSIRRKSCLYTVNAILTTLCHAIAPILPHLAEEVYLHHPVYGTEKKLLFFNRDTWTPPEFWNDDSANEIIQLVDKIKKEIFNVKSLTQIALIEIDEDNFELLKGMQGGKEQSTDSELTEMLEVAEVRLKIGDGKFSVIQTDSTRCLRCRRYTATDGNQLCGRCETIVSKWVVANHGR